jgi:hypothetical protein
LTVLSKLCARQGLNKEVWLEAGPVAIVPILQGPGRKRP